MSAAVYPYVPLSDHPHAFTARAGDWTPGYAERSKLVPYLFLPSIAMSGLSWLAGGIDVITDLSFVILTVVLAGLFLNELAVFPRRFGIGGLITFGGALLWWCYDYNTRWLGYRGGIIVDDMFAASSLDSVPARVLAKSVYLHSVFLLFMALGLNTNKWLVVSRLAFKSIEPRASIILFVVVLLVFFAAMIPYMFFAQEDPITALWLTITAGRSSAGATWTTGRTGNLNYSWGGYLTVLIQLGYAGATLAIFHALLFTRSYLQKAVCWFIFLLQTALAFGTGTRGNVVFVCLPLALLLFLKYNYLAAAMAKRFSIRSYVITLVALFAMLIVVQVQGYFRNEGFSAESFQNVEVKELRGNEMFTTTLPGMSIFPEKSPFLDQPFPGAGIVLAMPKTIYWFAIGPIPRAMWNDKPVDTLWARYNAITTGRGETDYEGTTVSKGAVGDAYFRYGVAGVIQFGLMYGWLLRNAEVGIRYAADKPVALLALLGVATFMFRSFRDFSGHDLYPVIYSCFAMSAICFVLNGIVGRGQRV